MNKNLYILFIITFITNCTTNVELQIDKKNKILVNNESCNISFSYPVVTNSRLDSTTLSELNWIFYNMPEYDYYSHGCNEKRSEKNVIKGDYKILLQKDSILSIEYITVLQHYYGNKQDTIYHSMVLNTKLIKENMTKMLWGILPEQIIPNFDRGKLKPYVEKYNITAERTANILAYESGSSYVITWGLTKDNFIIYVADEGEGHGFEKIEIPIEKLK